MVGYALETSAPPFPAFVLGYCINGFGMSLQVHDSLLIRTHSMSKADIYQDAGANGYLSSWKESTETKMGIMHAVYGPPITNSTP